MEGDGDLRQRYHRLVELAPDSILIHDGERILMANAAAVRLAGAAHRDQLVGRPIDTFLSPPYLKAFEEQFLGSDDLRPPDPVRDTFHRLDGSQVMVEVTAIPFMEAGRPAAHLVIRDITERLAAQAAAIRAEAQKLAAVRTLAGGVAHEVNNAMTVALGFSEFLLRDRGISKDGIASVLQIQKAADRAAAVARQLLSFSRRTPAKPKVIGLDASLRDMVPMVEQLLHDGQLLTTTWACPDFVWADPRHLEQIVINLVLNGRDAMPSGGSLVLATSKMLVGKGMLDAFGGFPIPAGRYGLLTVADTGVGMDAETITRIFEPFFTTKPVGEGTGLGLSVLDGLLEQSGGYITVASAPGLGTTFTLYFSLVPEARTADPAEQEPREPGGALKGATVLVVDDEPGVRELARRILEAGGGRVLEATDGNDALDVVSRHGPPDLALVDVVMRGMGGVDLAARLQERWPGLRILFMSGYSEDHLQRHGIVDAASNVMEKPFVSETLTRSVEAALARAPATW